MPLLDRLNRPPDRNYPVPAVQEFDMLEDAEYFEPPTRPIGAHDMMPPAGRQNATELARSVSASLSMVGAIPGQRRQPAAPRELNAQGELQKLRSLCEGEGPKPVAQPRPRKNGRRAALMFFGGLMILMATGAAAAFRADPDRWTLPWAEAAIPATKPPAIVPGSFWKVPDQPAQLLPPTYTATPDYSSVPVLVPIGIGTSLDPSVATSTSTPWFSPSITPLPSWVATFTPTRSATGAGSSATGSVKPSATLIPPTTTLPPSSTSDHPSSAPRASTLEPNSTSTAWIPSTLVPTATRTIVPTSTPAPVQSTTPTAHVKPTKETSHPTPTPTKWSLPTPDPTDWIPYPTKALPTIPYEPTPVYMPEFR